jgi:hypothetical protein
MKSTPIKIFCILYGLSLFTGCSDSHQRSNSEKQEGALPDTAPADTMEIDLQDKTVHPDTTDREDTAVDDKAVKADDWPKPSSFTEEHTRILQDALVIAVRVTEDTLFNQIITELADSDEIDWGSNRLSSIPRARRNAPTAFILSELDSRGMNNISDFQAYVWEPGSNTTGSVLACDTLPKVNVNLLTRSLRSIAGTMVHERVHSFCQKHRYNSKDRDGCDLAYHAGSLAIAIDAFRENGSRPFRSRSEICDALRKRLVSRGILEQDRRIAQFP